MIIIPSALQKLINENETCDRTWFRFFEELTKGQNSAGGGTVTQFTFNDANGISGSVTNATTTPELTLLIDEVDGGAY